MSDSHGALALEISANLGWLNALARSLVGDSAADDLVQDAIETTLKNPPATDRPLKPWLGTVMRNAARFRWRTDARRARREQSSPPPSEGTRADTALERLEVQQQLLAAVIKLAEPYRSSIILRYVDGQSAADIARQLDVPAATVRSRLKRGLDMLRTHLDDKSGGDRASWHVALAPLVGPIGQPVASAGIAGLIAKLLVVCAAVAGLAVVAISYGHSPPAEQPPMKASVAGAVADTATETAPERASTPAVPANDDHRPRRFRDSQSRQQFADRIRQARDRTPARVHVAPTAAPEQADLLPPPTVGTLDRDYIQERIAEIIPLVRECYELALVDDDTLEGQLTVQFTIDAEEEVGGYVSDAVIAEDSPLQDPLLSECVLETLLSVEFMAPEGGGQIRVSYPFRFQNRPDER